MSLANNGKELKSGADVVVRTLEERGVTHVFGVSGGKIDKFTSRLHD
jgi:acetolactate synthase-1/2/3 large subunit